MYEYSFHFQKKKKKNYKFIEQFNRIKWLNSIGVRNCTHVSTCWVMAVHCCISFDNVIIIDPRNLRIHQIIIVVLRFTTSVNIYSTES